MGKLVLGPSGISHEVTATAARWRKHQADLVLQLAVENPFFLAAAWYFEDNGDLVCLR